MLTVMAPGTGSHGTHSPDCIASWGVVPLPAHTSSPVSPMCSPQAITVVITTIHDNEHNKYNNKNNNNNSNDNNYQNDVSAKRHQVRAMQIKSTYICCLVRVLYVLILSKLC